MGWGKSEMGAGRKAVRLCLLFSLLQPVTVAQGLAATADDKIARILASLEDPTNGPDVVTIELDVVYGNQSLGAMTVRTRVNELVAARPSDLAQKLGGRVDEDVVAQLFQMGAVFVPVSEIGEVGINIRLDPATLTVLVDAPNVDAGPLNVSLVERVAVADQVTTTPARVSAGITGNLRFSNNLSNGNNTTADLAFNGFANVGGIEGVNLDFGGVVALSNGSGEDRFAPDRTVLFVDRPKQATRYAAGTLFNNLSTAGGVSDYLGVGVTRSFQELQPTRVLQQLGRRSFQLERPAEVTVLVNGQEITRFDAPAGPVNVSDIPLIDISNNVTIVIEDEFGRRVSENFRIASDIALLQKGLFEYSVGAGYARDLGRVGFNYLDTAIATGSLRYGLTSNLTHGMFGYYDEGQYLAGTSATFGGLGGLVDLELNYSDTDELGGDIAASLDYLWSNATRAERGTNIAVGVDVQGENFRAVGLEAANAVEYDVNASLQRDFSQQFSVNAAYSHRSFYDLDEEDSVGTLGLSYSLGDFVLNSRLRYRAAGNTDDEVGLFFNLVHRLGDRTNSFATYDSISERSSLGFRRVPENTLGAIGYDAVVTTEGEQANLRTGASLRSNRFDSRLNFTAQSAGGAFDGDQIVSGRLQSGLAFANGRFAIGRDPGRGFYLVRRHPTLLGAELAVSTGSIYDVRAKTGTLGPALVPTLGQFRQEVLRIQVKNAPQGYNTGRGVYIATPGARSGFDIEIGSDSFRSLTARFHYNGEPLSLAGGRVVSLSDGKESVIFTNRTGRALISNLGLGQYRVEIANVPVSYMFEITDTDEYYQDIGIVEMGGQ